MKDIVCDSDNNEESILSHSHVEDVKSSTVSLQRRISWKVSSNINRGIYQTTPSDSHWLGNFSNLTFANIEQLQYWYRNEGEQVVKNIITSGYSKKAWQDYTLNFNLHKSKEYGFLLPSTIETIIRTFGVEHFNKFNFLGLLSGKLKPEDISSETNRERWNKKYMAKAENLRDWYDNKGGDLIVKKCLESSDYIGAWREYATTFNTETCIEVGYTLPITINSLVFAFGVKKVNKMSFFGLLSGKMTKEDFETTIQNGVTKLTPLYSATREILQEWYKKEGYIFIQTILSSPGYESAWKNYATNFNKEQFLTEGYRLQETIGGVIRVFFPNATKYNKEVFLACFTTDISLPLEKKKRKKKHPNAKKVYPILFPIQESVKPEQKATLTKSTKKVQKSGENKIKNENITPNQIVFINNRFPSLLEIPRKYLGPFHLFIRKIERFLNEQEGIKYTLSEKEIGLEILDTEKFACGKILIKEKTLGVYEALILQCLDETLELWEDSVNKRIRANIADPSVHFIIEKRHV
ncbi:MAG: hypothetical protein PHQ95_00355 [Candidatus Gracilibacteria bacterium]|nr:hypothetical protein [Candidatus Gracilibacteria bacterium]